MDPGNNPYTPNAGAQPPFLVGRDDQLARFDILLRRLQRGYTDQSMLVTGLRGVGKTVLLGAFREQAEELGWAAVDAEITRHGNFATRILHLSRRALLRVSPSQRWREAGRRAAATLKSFQLSLSPEGKLGAGFDVQALEGAADSGDLGEDLGDLFVALGEAARDHDSGIVFLLDEVQFLDLPELEALIAALHRTVQRSLPVTLVGAGLPQMPRLAGEAKSYAERLFTFPHIGSLPQREAVAALTSPAEQLGVLFEPDACQTIVDYTEGYPYFLQEYGKVVWDATRASPVTAADVAACQELVEAKLDASFFHVRAERTTELELNYLRAMAELGNGAQKASDVARMLGRNSEQLGPMRSRLIDKGLLYTPGYGLAAFTVPQFDRYLIRNHALTDAPTTRKPAGGAERVRHPTLTSSPP